MQKEKFKKYANKMKFAIVVILLACAGILYSCNFKANGDNIQFATLESNVEYATGEIAVTSSSNSKAIESNTELAKICVYVCGCVINPGVYELHENMRVYQAIEMAGGMTEYANYNYLNLADYLTDGQKIYVPDIDENLSNQVSPQALDNSSSTLVNINSATKDQLMTLPGIGESRAVDIIAYRTTNNKFETIEDIKKVSGIKDAAFSKIKDLIVVK